MTTASLAVRPVSPVVGAEILGLNLADSLPASTTEAIRHALFQHGVVFFRTRR